VWPGRVGWAGRPYWRYRTAWRRYPYWGAAAIGAGILASSYYPYGYYDSCWRWNGWDWVNVCYGPAYYGGYAPY
jgi:hypothetical protein